MTKVSLLNIRKPNNVIHHSRRLKQNSVLKSVLQCISLPILPQYTTSQSSYTAVLKLYQK